MFYHVTKLTKLFSQRENGLVEKGGSCA